MSDQKRAIMIGGMGTMLGFSAKHLRGSDSPMRVLRVHDRLKIDGRKEALRADWDIHGAERVSDYGELVGDGDFDCVIVCAGKNGDGVEIYRELGPLLNERCGAPPTILDMSTVSAGFARAAESYWGSLGIPWAGYPVTGGPTGARTKKMLILASGPEGVFSWLEPTLERLGVPRYYGGDIAAGAKAKLIGHKMVFCCLQGVASAVAADAFAFRGGDIGGDDQVDAIDFLNGGAGGTRQWDVAMRLGVADGEWGEGFLAHHAAVDAAYAAQLAVELGLPYESCVRPLLLTAAQLAYVLRAVVGEVPVATHAIAPLFVGPDAAMLDDFLAEVLHRPSRPDGFRPEDVISQVVEAFPEKVRRTVALDVTAESFAA